MSAKDRLLDTYQSVPCSHLSEENMAYYKPLCRGRCWYILMVVLVLLSALVNVFLTTALLRSNSDQGQTNERSTEILSPFAKLPRNVLTQWNGNHASTDKEWADLWTNHSKVGPGIVALRDDYAQEHDLPRSQRWPWDSTKGIYIINAYHNLHCVQRIRASLEDFKYGRAQRIAWAHVQHCLLTLRDEIHCNADDTPRYTGFQPASTSGYGQTRMCRDWSKLEAWALDHVREGCWRDIPGEVGVDGFRVLDRYRYCSEGNPYREMAETMWLSDDGWATEAST